MSWSVGDAKARFSELLEASLKDGAQIITRRGVETVAVVPIDQWRDLQQRARPTLKDLLLAPEPRFEEGLPCRRRGGWRWRAPPVLD